MDNLNTATKGQLHGLREPAAVRNEAYMKAAIDDLHTASGLTANVAVHASYAGLSEKQMRQLEKVTRILVQVRSQLLNS
jgi:hypothetical protein